MSKLQTFKSKVSNFFYHYKWHTVFVLFFVVVISIMVFQMCTKDSYDVKVMYAGPEVLADTESAAVEKALLEIANIDEKEPLEGAALYELTIMNDEELKEVYDDYGGSINPQVLQKNREIFTHQVLSDEYFLLFLSPECYDIYRSNECLVPLSYMGITEGTEAYEYRNDEYSFLLSELDCSTFFTAFSVFPDDTVVCVKRINEMNPGDGEEVQKNHIKIFKKMISFKLPADFVPPTEQPPAQQPQG